MLVPLVFSVAMFAKFVKFAVCRPRLTAFESSYNAGCLRRYRRFHEL